MTNSNIVNDKFLKEFNVVINLKHHLLICKTCKYVVEVNSVINHIKRNHRSIIDCKNLNGERALEFLKYVRELDPMINSNFNIETEEIIEGLEIVNGLQCLECQYLCLNLSVIQKHYRKKHCDLKNFNYEKCKFQTLFLHPDKKKYFKVKENSELIIQDIIETEENDAIFGIKTSQVEPGNSLVDHRFVSLFHKEAELNFIIDKFTDEELKDILHLVNADSLVNAVHIVFNMGEKSSGGSDNYINEIIENPLSK